MPRWVLACAGCKIEFTHTELPEPRWLPPLDPFTGHVSKPDIPTGGVNGECPNCKIISLYQRNELVFRAT
jgi:hypothetical protein